MAVNKVVMNGENGAVVLVDLTGDSVTPETLAEGVTAHDASGNPIVGRMASGITGDISLGVHTDGLLYIFVNGEPVGNGIEMPDTVGDVYGYIDSGNTIVLKGYVPNGTYTFKYELPNETLVSIGSAEIDNNIYYAISKSLTYCTINNSAARVAEGNVYSATIAANSGYTLSTVKVTMGGTDITSSAVSGGTITISSVTGDIVITATAIAQSMDYSVTNTLTKCTTSNSATKATKGSIYSSTISANTNCVLSTVKVTMGGTDITSSAVSGGTINISNVTGNIVITAKAITNQIKASTDVDGNPYNGGQGWKTGYRLSLSGGGESAYSNFEVIGFVPVTRNSVIRLKNVAILSDNYHGIVGYDSSRNKITSPDCKTGLSSIFTDSPVNGVYTSSPLYAYGIFASDKLAYIRICSSDINDTSILTIDEEIV